MPRLLLSTVLVAVLLGGQESGAQDIWDRARMRAQQILTDHHPSYLEPDVDNKIRTSFNILLDPGAQGG